MSQQVEAEMGGKRGELGRLNQAQKCLKLDAKTKHCVAWHFTWFSFARRLN